MARRQKPLLIPGLAFVTAFARAQLWTIALWRVK